MYEQSLYSSLWHYRCCEDIKYVSLHNEFFDETGPSFVNAYHFLMMIL